MLKIKFFGSVAYRDVENDVNNFMKKCGEDNICDIKYSVTTLGIERQKPYFSVAITYRKDDQDV